MQSAFILGADSAIANSLWKALSANGVRLVGTTRRRQRVCGNIDLFDLASDSAQSLDPKTDVGYLCAAITSMAQCEANSAGTREVNVWRLVEIAKRLHDLGMFVVFLSSSAVFDGTEAFMQEGANPNPANEYGRQKAEAESHVLALGGTAVVRLTKVLDAGTAIVEGWRKDLLEGRVIHPFEDLVMAPVSKRFATGLLWHVGECRGDGVFHGSGEKDLSYADFADMLAAALGADRNLVVPVSSEEAGVKLEFRPRFSALGMGATKARLGIGTQPAEELICEILQAA